MPIRDIITRQFRLFQGLRSIEEDNHILERMYARCAMELLLILDHSLPLAGRRLLHAKVGDIVTEHPVGPERSRLLLQACLHELEFSKEAAAQAEKKIRSLVRQEFAYAADKAIARKETAHA